MMKQCTEKLLFEGMEVVTCCHCGRYCFILKKTIEKIKYCE